MRRKPHRGEKMRRTNLMKKLCLTGAFLFLAGCSSIYAYLPATSKSAPPPSKAVKSSAQASESGPQPYFQEGDGLSGPNLKLAQDHRSNVAEKQSTIDPRVQRLEKRVAELEARQTIASSTSPTPPKKPARKLKQSPKGSPPAKKPPAAEASGAGPGI